MVKVIFALVGGFCVTVMATLGYAGVALLMGIESACVPLPSELIMPYAGAMTIAAVGAELGAQFHQQLPVFNLLLAAVAGAIGCNLGSEVAYWVGAKGGRRAIERYGRYVLVSKHELGMADRWFEQRGDIIILVARLLPVVRTFIAFPAGVARMNRLKFHAYTFVGSLPWCYGLAYVGQQLGIRLLDEHSPLKSAMHKFDALIGAVIIVAGAYFVWSRIKVYRQYKLEGSPKSTPERGTPAPPAKAE